MENDKDLEVEMRFHGIKGPFMVFVPSLYPPTHVSGGPKHQSPRTEPLEQAACGWKCGIEL